MHKISQKLFSERQSSKGQTHYQIVVTSLIYFFSMGFTLLIVAFTISTSSGTDTGGDMSVIALVRTAYFMIFIGVVMLVWAISQSQIWKGKDTEETLQLKQVDKNITTKIEAMYLDTTKAINERTEAIKELTKEVHDGFANQQKTQGHKEATKGDNERPQNQ
jgi:cytochrome c biogenesis protein CcdA